MAVLTMMRRSGAGSAVTDVFRGYDHNPRGPEGSFYEMQNMTGRDFPVISTRPFRTVLRQLTAPAGCVARDELAVVDGPDLIYGDTVVELGLSPEGPKQMISMGAYLLIWPDKKYVNTQDLSDRGSMENSTAVSGTITVTLCQADGGAYTVQTVSATAPDNPDNGDLWLDISAAELPVLKEWNAASGMWVQIPTTYLKFAATGVGSGFSLFDGVTFSGLSDSLAGFNGSHVVYGVGADYLIIPGIAGAASLTGSGMSVTRTVPDMDFVTESGNRIWGCKYGLVNGKPVNEIYASKLGDFKNWNCYMGLSTDSFAASRGADGAFTGAITLQGHPLFFRENSIEKVYPGSNGAHQIVTTEGRGVQKGCWRSLAIVGETLFYKSRDGVCAYTGSLPYSVSEPLGDVTYSDARAGAAGDRYYISMKAQNGQWSLFVFDTANQMWHREDNTMAMAFTRWEGEAVWIDERSGKLIRAAGDAEDDFHWSVTSRALGYEFPENQYVSRFVIRAETEGTVTLEIQYDNGPWLDKGSWYGAQGVRSFVLPVPPRRCDHLRIRMSGTAPCRIYAIARHMRRGSDTHREEYRR